MKKFGSRMQVWNQDAFCTVGGLKKCDLVCRISKRGKMKILSKRKVEQGKKLSVYLKSKKSTADKTGDVVEKSEQ